MKKYVVSLCFSLLAGMTLVSSQAFANLPISKAPADAKVYIISPADGASFSAGEKITVRFGLSGMGVAPAGTNRDKTGHHHLLINQDMAKINLKAPLPSTKQIVHFGGGQTETSITLPKGKHTLQLLLGNYLHIPHDKAVASEKITITVK